VVTKEQALQAIWPDTVVEEANLSQNIFLLRKLLGEKETGQKIILTRTGVGYSFRPDVREIEETPPQITTPKRRWLAPAVVIGLAILGYASTVALSRRSSPYPTVSGRSALAPALNLSRLSRPTVPASHLRGREKILSRNQHFMCKTCPRRTHHSSHRSV
jgi:hypothetical protein